MDGWFLWFFFFYDLHILHFELLALFLGLTIAWNRSYCVVECQSDSLDAVTLVKFVPSSRHLYASVFWHIKELLNKYWIVDLHHTLREVNA